MKHGSKHGTNLRLHHHSTATELIENQSSNSSSVINRAGAGDRQSGEIFGELLHPVSRCVPAGRRPPAAGQRDLELIWNILAHQAMGIADFAPSFETVAWRSWLTLQENPQLNVLIGFLKPYSKKRPICSALCRRLK